MIRSHAAQGTGTGEKVRHKMNNQNIDLCVEPLERRVLLAGMVEGVVRGSTLRLTGDDLSNSIVIATVADQVSITGNATSVNIEGDLGRVQRIVYESGGGNDTTAIENLDLSRSITIISEGAHDVSIVNSTFSSGRISLAGDGNHDLFIDDSTINRGFVFQSEQGDVQTSINGDSEIGRRFSMTVEVGNDDFRMSDNARIDGALLRRTLNGDSSTILEDNAVVTRLVSAKTSNGAADVQVVEEAEIGWYRGSGVTKISNVVYATRDSGDLLADVYIPKTEGPHPAILAIHGGYWRFGSKAAMSGRAKTLADRGYVVVNINYRLADAPDVVMEDIIHDVKSAIIWMRENAATYNIDPDNIGTYGFSAGGHLALMMGVTDGSEGLEGPDANGTSTRVQAVVAGAPGTDFRNRELDNTRFEYLFGGTRGELPQEYIDASPGTWASADDPAIMMYYGTSDNVISQDNLLSFQQDLDAAGVENELLEIEGGTHLSVRVNRNAMLQSLKFLDEQLK